MIRYTYFCLKFDFEEKKRKEKKSGFGFLFKSFVISLLYAWIFETIIGMCNKLILATLFFLCFASQTLASS